MQKILSVLAAAESNIRTKEIILEDRVKRLSQMETEFQAMELNIALTEKTEQTLAYISARVLGQSVTTIDKLVTAGLKIVFDDLDLEFKTEVEKYRGKTSIKFLLTEGGKVAPIMTSYGGGPLVVCGVLLRVTTIIILGLNKTLLLDESLAHLSSEYIENASKLLKKLCKELGFNILMVTHQNGFAQHADAQYEAKKKGQATTFTLVKKF